MTRRAEPPPGRHPHPEPRCRVCLAVVEMRKRQVKIENAESARVHPEVWVAYNPDGTLHVCRPKDS